MKVSARTIPAIAKVVTGDTFRERGSDELRSVAPYRSGPVLVKLFNEFGFDDEYGQGFPSRWMYAEEKLRALNGSDKLPALLREVFDPRDWHDENKPREQAASYLNDYLKHDGYELATNGEFFAVRALQGGSVSFEYSAAAALEVNQVFIDEQVEKSERKLRDGDHDGAITNARSLVEAILVDVEKELSAEAVAYDGDLPKLYRRVQKVLNLEPSQKDISDSLKQLLGGLASVIHGIAGLSNVMSDRHVRTFEPTKEYATLVVNAAKTLAAFVIGTRDGLRHR